MKRRDDYAVYLAMRAALGVVRVLPRGLALGAGGMLGGSARAVGMRRAVTDENLARAFPELSAAQRAELAGRVFRHFGRMAVDSMRLSAVGPKAVVPLVTGGDVANLVRERLPRGRGALILTGHVGNWELAGAYMAAVGLPLAAVVKPPANRYIAEHTERTRQRLGIETIPMPEARTAVTEALKRGKVVALVADQGALRSTTWVPFFGHPTRTPSGPGYFAAKSGAPVFFGALVTTPDGGYRLEGDVLAEEVTDEPGVAIERIAAAYRRRLEQLVRQVPEQYLWTHRLWKTPPPAPGRPAAGR